MCLGVPMRIKAIHGFVAICEVHEISCETAPENVLNEHAIAEQPAVTTVCKGRVLRPQRAGGALRYTA